MCLKPYVIVTDADDPHPHVFYGHSAAEVICSASEYYDNNWHEITSLTIRELDEGALLRFLLKEAGIPLPAEMEKPKPKAKKPARPKLHKAG